MNRSQELWRRQAVSDHEVFEVVRRTGVAPCHALHYLQMVTEKIAKAYFWRSGSPRPRSHAGFVQFLRFLGAVGQRDRDRLATLFSFPRFSDFQNWVRTVQPLAYDLERIAPNLANDGPNSEYPWPHHQPEYAPAQFRFPVWQELRTGRGRDLMRFVRIAVRRFPEYADA